MRERAYIARSALNESGKFEVVGIMTLLAHRKGKVFDEISPKTVKKMIGGDGRATKQQVADGLTHYVGLLPFACDDESDAVALGLTWLMQHGTLQPLDPSL